MQGFTVYKQLICVAAVSAVLFGCSDMNDIHNEVAEKYAGRGESIYIGKPDSLIVMSGKERLMLRYWVSDSRASKLLVYWSSRTDSAIFDIPENLSPGDSVDVIVPDLAENNYQFEIYTTDRDMKYKSVPIMVSARTYGERFQSSLSDRLLKNVIYDIANNLLTVQWYDAIESSVLGAELKYVDVAGNIKTAFVPKSEAQNDIDDLKSNLMSRTVFLPDPMAIDTFYTEYTNVAMEDYLPFEQLLDPSSFGRWNPPGIPYSQNASFAIENLWDGITFNNFYLFNTDNRFTAYPIVCTFDLGQVLKLDGIRIFQRIRDAYDLIYRHAQNVRTFEIWGAKDMEGLNQDHSSGWVKIGAYTIEKPSGLPYGEINEEDIQAALEGHYFDIGADAPMVRYVRIDITGKWVDAFAAGTSIGELQIFGTHPYFLSE